MNTRFIRRIVYPTPADTETLFYFLLEDTDPARYGVRIMKTSSSGTLLSQEAVPSVTSDRSVMMQILKLLIDGSVSPCTLHDVIEDLTAVG